VRFIYARPRDWYLSLQPQRDVIELPIDDLLDVNGWDIQKALRLLCKPNPVLLEWLQSPIVYRREAGFAERLRALYEGTDHRAACRFHYTRLGRQQFATSIDGREHVALKKYFYSLRPALALAWLRANPGLVPMDMDGLIAGVRLPRAVPAEIDRLLAAKQRTREMGEGPRFSALDAFMLEEFAAAEASTERPKVGAGTVAAATALFRKLVRGRAAA
jgi:predicted nucleotidyltransferase